MSTYPLRPVGFEDRLTLTGHLTELRTRLIVCAATLLVAFSGCLWQSRALLHVLDRPLASVHTSTASSPDNVAFARGAAAFKALAHSATCSPRWGSSRPSARSRPARSSPGSSR